MSDKKSPWARIGQIALLLLILAVLPAISYLYLKQGADYRRAALNKLDDYGQAPALASFPAIFGKLPDPLAGQMLVVGWIDGQHAETRTRYAETLRQLHEQFDEAGNLHFITLAQSTLDPGELNALIEQYNLTDRQQLSFLQLDERDFYRSVEQFNLPQSDFEAPGTKPIVALVDTAMTIRAFYDLSREGEAGRLVEHIAMILPLPAERDIVLKREQEK